MIYRQVESACKIVIQCLTVLLKDMLNCTDHIISFKISSNLQLRQSVLTLSSDLRLNYFNSVLNALKTCFFDIFVSS